MTKSRITDRRLRDAATAMAIPDPKPDATIDELQAQIDLAEDGIRALQSLDDLGAAMNVEVNRDIDELFLRVERWKELREQAIKAVVKLPYSRGRS